MRAYALFKRKVRLENAKKILIAGTVAITALTVGCGTGAGGAPPSPTKGSSIVNLYVTSVSNNQYAFFKIALEGLSLTTSSGKSVNLITKTLAPDFIPVNGAYEPVAITTVPQGTYTGARITLGGATVGCVAIDPSSGAVVTGDNADQQVPPSDVSVTLPEPIAISGSSMALSLKLVVSKSVTLSGCSENSTHSITPEFTLGVPKNVNFASTSGLASQTGILGRVTSINASSGMCKIEAANVGNGIGWTVMTRSSTAFEGVSGLPALTPDMPVYVNLITEPDGSLVATRLQVLDTNTRGLSILSGPILQSAQVYSQSGSKNAVDYLLEVAARGPLAGNANYFNFTQAKYETAGQFTNLENLPFVATFNDTTMVPGQRIVLTSHASTVVGSFPYTSASTVTLLPQTIDGTVTGISSDNGFKTYTVTLPSYDPFPLMPTAKGVSDQIADPNTVVVYADSNTLTDTSNSLSIGGVYRFHGLVFDNQGTLRMDSDWIRDGVAVGANA